MIKVCRAGALGYLNWVPDKIYLKILFLLRMGKRLHLSNPVSFNEKLQWLKLYDRNPQYSRMVDKCEAKDFVASRIGSEHIVPTYGVWNSVEEIEYGKLPDKFVLKCTHDSGGVVICRDKQILNYSEAQNRLQLCLKRNYYCQGREWPYKNVKPRIMAEKYIDGFDGKGVIDYKFYCFNGEPQFLYVSQGMDNHQTARISFVTLDWQLAKFQRSDYTMFEVLPKKPTCFDEMIDISRKLSFGIPFVRVDLYEINGTVLFSELTFSPCGGFMRFRNEDDDIRVGKLLTLPQK